MVVLPKFLLSYLEKSIYEHGLLKLQSNLSRPWYETLLSFIICLFKLFSFQSYISPNTGVNSSASQLEVSQFLKEPILFILMTKISLQSGGGPRKKRNSIFFFLK